MAQQLRVSYSVARMKEYPFLTRLSSFTGRAVVFFFLLSVILFFFYLLGNYQDFLDSTQYFLLAMLRLSLALEVASGAYLAVFLVRSCVNNRRPYVVRWILLVLSMSASGGLLLALQYIRAWLRA